MEPLADIIIDRVVESLDHPFTYRIPPELVHVIAVGQWVTVPFGKSEVFGVVRQVRFGSPDGLKDVKAIRQLDPVLTPVLLELAEWMQNRYLCFLSQAIRSIVPSAVRNDVAARPSFVWYRVQQERHGRRSLKQTIYEYVGEHPDVERQTVLGMFPDAGPALLALVRESALQASIYPPNTVHEPSRPVLTEHQEKALASLKAGPNRAWLLQGVTGSGKTEIYLSLIESALAQGRQAMVLLPEIALTPQTLTRFRERFGIQVAVWHSGLSHGQRRSTWDGVRQGQIGVVVGARSAVFLPFPDLGVIVLDEEHEPSYKQEEHPRYHTREVALWRGQKEKATVVLGSATPSVESRYGVHQGQLELVELPERVGGRAMPRVTIVDMRQELKEGHREIFSRLLKESLIKVLECGQQAILFLNRRGYSTFILCRSCGTALECSDCSVSLTFHQREHRLFCHYCLKDFPVPDECPECHSDKIRHFGAGTERVVEEVERLFPKARILRADRDTLTRSQDYAELYHRFYDGEADVLVGTQMIAKGMDFPRVGLVGVVAADTALHLPDFRSAERTFQLLVQAAGRSGRKDATGEVVIQTYNPDHYAIRWAETHNYPAFFTEEIAYRAQTRYPPYADLWLLLFEGEQEADVKERALAVVHELRSRWPAKNVLGPAPAPLARVRGQYRYQVLVKSFPEAGDEDLIPYLKELKIHDRQLSLTRDPYFLM